MHPLAHRSTLTGPGRLALIAAFGMGAVITLTGCAETTTGTVAPNAGSEIMTTAEPLAGTCAGVEITVDFGILGGDPIDDCVDIESTTSAVDVLSAAGVSVAGTVEYGNAVLCRVNDLPNATTPIRVEGHEPYIETCESMPPEFAYWDIWLKQGTGDWAYAMVGENEITVSPGDAIGLVFNTGTSTPAPQ